MVVPVATPVITPVSEPAAATEGVTLNQVPPGAEVSVIPAPMHTADGPLITGNGFTVTVVVAAQPLPVV